MSESLSEASRDARALLADLGRRYHAAGWMMGTAGNLSARVGEDRVVVTASGRDKGALGPEDFVEVDLGGAVRGAGPGRRPSAETSIHLAVYRRRAAARGVLHVHTVASTLLLPDHPLPADVPFDGLEMVKGWGLWEDGARAPLRVFPNHAHVPDIGRDVEAWLGDEGVRVPAFLIAGHGLTAWGESLDEAHRHVEITEFLCRVGLARARP